MMLPRITARQRALRSFVFASMAALALPCLGEGVDVQCNEQGQWVDASENGVPILRYNHGVTPVPNGVDKAFERGDYVSALYGLNGELLTEDFPADHVHHRAINWSWATVKWNNETRDMFAVRNPYEGPVTGGLWARPVRMVHAASGASPGGGPEFGAIIAESEWRWDDKTAIVLERLQIIVYPKTDTGRLIDFRIELEPLVDGLEFCGRLDAGYSGFNIRMAVGENRTIAFHTDPPDANPRMAWADYTAAFNGGHGTSGVALLQHKDNPMYPQEWREYPDLNFFQPIYPGGQLVPMTKGLGITLRYRLWIHPGALSEEDLANAWSTYNGASSTGEPTEGAHP